MKNTLKSLVLCLIFGLLILSPLQAKGQSNTTITNLNIAETENGKKAVTVALSNSDYSNAVLEYSVDREIYSTDLTAKNGNTLNFKVDCSLKGEYKLLMLHLTNGKNETVSLEISNQSFKIDGIVSPMINTISILKTSGTASLSNSSMLKNTNVSAPLAETLSNGKNVAVLKTGYRPNYTDTYGNGFIEEVPSRKMSFDTYGELKSSSVSTNPIFNTANVSTLSAPKLASGKKVVVLDPGHCSKHAGAYRNGMREEVLNYKIALATYNELKNYPNIEVYMTRGSSDCPGGGGSTSTCLYNRALLAKNKNADLFVSFHNNSTGAQSQTSSSGAYVYVSNHSRYDNCSRVLTNNILAEIKSRLGLATHGAWLNADDHSNGKYDDGRWQDDLSVIRNNTLFGIEPILIEHAFINNPNDRVILGNDAKLTQLGIADAQGILKYINNWTATALNASVNGETVSISTTVNGTATGLQYKYVYIKQNSATGEYDWKEWGVIRDFNTSSSTTWKAPSEGTYKIVADIKDPNGKYYFGILEKEVKTVNFGGSSARLTGVNLPTSVTVGESFNISPQMTGTAEDIAKIQYKYVWCKNNWKEWDVIKNLSTSSSASYTPPTSGTYQIYVDAKYPNGTIVNTYKDITVKNVDIGFSGVSVTPSQTTVGKEVTVKPILNKPISELKYKYVWQVDNWKKWGVIKGFSTGSSVKYTPTVPGRHKLYVDIMYADGTIISKNTEITVDEVNIGYTGVNVTPSVKVGQTITATTNISNRLPNLEYKYVWCLNNDWSNWDIFKDWSNSTTASFTATRPGTYYVYVDVRLPKCEPISQIGKSVSSLGWTANSVSITPSTVKKNEQVTITGSQSGAVSPQYKFVYCIDGRWADGTWGVIKGFSTSSSTTFKPQKSGTYTIYMDVKDKYNNIKTITKTFTVK